MGNRIEGIKSFFRPEKRKQIIAAGVGVPLSLYGSVGGESMQQQVHLPPAIVRDVRHVIPHYEQAQVVNTRTGDIVHPYRSGRLSFQDFYEENEGEEPVSVASDLHSIDELQQTFNKALGLHESNDVIRSYNPVLARWKFEQCKTSEEKAQFLLYEKHQIETMFREMCRVDSSPNRYVIDSNGKLCSEHFPDEPFEKVLLRGIEYRKQHNTPEPEREWKEMVGMIKIQEHLATAPFGTKMVLISPPGIVTGTAYKDNFIDYFEKGIDEKTKQEIITLTRTISPLNYPQTIERILELQPDYFNNYTGPLDAYFLENPFECYEEIVQGIGMKEEVFRENVLPHCERFGQYLLTQITRKTFSPFAIAQAQNAAQVACAQAKEAALQGKNIQSGQGENEVHPDITVEVAQLAEQAFTEEIAGCGRISNFDLSSGPNSNSVAKFAGRSEATFNLCGKCFKPADGHYHCPTELGGCGMQYADETNKSRETRTKKCECGFTFGC